VEPASEIRVRALADQEIERVAAVLGLAPLYQGNGFYLVAWENDEPLGHAYLALTDPPELQDVYVRTEHRRRGIGSTPGGSWPASISTPTGSPPSSLMW
jgi:GNAT superfamily N-acetyltransferase